MNTPNKLTILRILMTPFFIAAMLIQFPHNYLVALVIFIIASLTDMLDGNIARKQGIVTDFGKFLDPLADKMLTTAAYLAFIALDMGYGITVITFIVLTREFLITSLRLIAAGDGLVIAASIFGKLKTVSQIVAIIATILFEYIISNFLGAYPDVTNILRVSYSVLLWFSCAMAVISGFQYLYDNRKYINPKK